MLMLTFKQFMDTNKIRCESKVGFNQKLDSWSTSDWMVACLGELGEAAKLAKKLNRCRDSDTEKDLKQKLKKELGNILAYLDLTCSSLGITLEEAAVDTFNEVSFKHKFPFVL